MSEAAVEDRESAHDGAPPDRAPARFGQLPGVLLLAGAAFVMTPWCTPQIALLIGIVLALVGLVPREAPTQTLARLLIQVSVVLLGFRMDLREVLRAGASGMLFAAGTIGATFALGALVRRWLGVDREVSTLISSGTAICGGSAIAAVGATIGASGSAMAVSLAAVFVLNGAALWIFPWLGHALGLSPEQFGTWAGVAIHDVSSVVGAGAEYDRITGDAGGTALATATVVKLTRVLWIVPVCIGVAWAGRRSEARAGLRKDLPARISIPWFVVLFLLAALVHTLVPAAREAGPQIEATARVQMRLALFLIGTGLSLEALRTVGWRALAQGITLWMFISVAALAVVMLAV